MYRHSAENLFAILSPAADGLKDPALFLSPMFASFASLLVSSAQTKVSWTSITFVNGIDRVVVRQAKLLYASPIRRR